MKVKKKAMKLKELSVLRQKRRFVTGTEALGFPALTNPKLLWDKGHANNPCAQMRL